ncbi:hypothetical protein ACFE04_025708 [Oxalis oulophora]
MDELLPKEIEVYIKETIDDSIGLSVSKQTLQLKLHAIEESRLRLRDQYFCILSKLKEKNDIIERTKAEATMNAVALKKFVEENQKLSAECSNLSRECKKWEEECAHYDLDREALFDFGNEADERAKEAEITVAQLEAQLNGVNEELQFYKRRLGDSSIGGTTKEENLLESILASLVSKDEVLFGHAFLEERSGNDDACRKLLKLWDSSKPLTQTIISLAAKVKALENDKESLRTNLRKAEDEVKLLFEENNILDEENKRLSRQLYNRGQNTPGTGGKQVGSAPAKTNKRKTSPGRNSPIEKKIDFARQPLSTLEGNSPGSKDY